MSLVIHHRGMGNLKVFDVRSRVNLNTLKPVFERLTVDPYVREGCRHKHIAWFKTFEGRLDRKYNRNVLYQSSVVNPVHGDMHRVYPTIACNEALLERLLDVFMTCADASRTEELSILVQFQRVTARNSVIGHPSIENWHHDGVTKVGIICVGRDNIVGGVSQFKDKHGKIVSMELPTGYMAIFEDAPIQHRVTEIEQIDDSYMGYRDVVLLAYGTSQQFDLSSSSSSDDESRRLVD